MIDVKKSILTVAVLALALSGCGEDRSHPKGVDANGNPINYANPTALIDLNATDHTYANATQAYTVGTGARNHLGSPFIFDGVKSHDNDENNQSITSYKWDFSFTHNPACVDIQKTSHTATFKFINTDTNNTCVNAAITPGEINATLTVTDNEGKTAIARKNIKTN